MDYWSWGGQYVGFREGNYLFSKKGTPIGVFRGNDLYNFKGRYIGEIRSKDRLLVNKSKMHCIAPISTIPCNRVGRSYCNYVGNIMIAGYEDFRVESE